MKQFDLQEYLKNPNREIVTRDGRSVRIICTDRKSNNLPIVGLVNGGQKENIRGYTKDGEYSPGNESLCDLFFAPKKKEGWIKVYYGKSRCDTFVCNRIFATKAEAERQKNDNVVAIIKIEWEE